MGRLKRRARRGSVVFLVVRGLCDVCAVVSAVVIWQRIGPCRRD